ncbi:hypothetical protein [Gordonia sp. CPCC 205333]|uniref:hypothetical protein n=1 Tax=Gordonia sp. CPCC 205333 TaxID=3140790 RepID=UPI003AF3B0F7
MSAGRHRQGPVPLIDRPIAAKPRKPQPRWMAGFLAIVVTAAVSMALVGGQGQARAALDPGNSSGSSLSDIINNIANGVLQPVADQWRIQMCSSGGSNGGADCSQSTNVGIAMVVPGTIELVPRLPYDLAQAATVFPIDLLGIIPDLPNAPEAQGTAKVIGDGVKFALASTGGNATAIALLPLSVATAGASGGRTAIAFAVLGIANAWTTDEIKTSILSIETPISIPGIERVDCFGVVTAAYAEKVGACANILGTFDAKLDLKKNQLQFGLTNPAGLADDPTSIFSELISSLLTTGNLPALSTLLTEDFGRLYLGGDELLGFTSDYGFSEPVTVNWLGQKVTLFPKMTAANGEQRPNYLGLPTFTAGAFDATQLLPTITAGPFKVPFLDSPLNPTNLTSTSDSATTILAAKKSSPTTLTAKVDENKADEDKADEEGVTPTSSDQPATETPAASENPVDDTSTAKSGDGISAWKARQREKFGNGGKSGNSFGSTLDKLRKNQQPGGSTTGSTGNTESEGDKPGGTKTEGDENGGDNAESGDSSSADSSASDGGDS